MVAIGLAWRQVRDRFRAVGLDTPELDARILAQSAFGLNSMALVRKEREAATEEQLTLLDQFAQRRLAGEPVSRIIGRREFWGLEFELNAATLDPRPETEMLVAEAIAVLERKTAPSFVDLGTGSGRMLTLFGGRVEKAIGLDLSQQMLNIARAQVADAGLTACELRHGDIFATRLPGQSADLVIVHQVLHYLSDPSAAVAEAARLVAPGGKLLIVDFAPHGLEYLREAHQHRRLGFTDEEIRRWLVEAGLQRPETYALPPKAKDGLTVKIWAARRKAGEGRAAA